MLEQQEQPEHNPTGFISNNILYGELLRLRDKLDRLESRVNYLFGGLATITVLVNIYELVAKVH